MYKIEIEPINEQADAPFFNEWLKTNYTNYIGYTALDPFIVYFSTDPTVQEVQDITNYYNALTSSDVLEIDNIVYTYSVRETDGKGYYNDVRASLYLEYQGGTLPIENAYYIEDKLLKVKGFLLSGDWLTAKYEMENYVVVNGVVSQTDINHQYTQARHDEILGYITNYVNTNYT